MGQAAGNGYPKASRDGVISAITGVVGVAITAVQYLTTTGPWAIVITGVIVLLAAAWWLTRLWAHRRGAPAAFLLAVIVAVSATTGIAADRLARPEVVTDPSAEASPSVAPPSTTAPPVLTTASTPPTTKDANFAMEPPIRRRTGSKGVTLPIYYSLDLDSTAANWGVTRGSPAGWDVLGAFGAYGINTFGDVGTVTGQPSYQTCEAATSLHRGVWRDDTHDGYAFCLRTDEKRWAWVRIIGVVPNEEINIDVLVWEIPG